MILPCTQIFAWSAVAIAAANVLRHVCNFTKPTFQTYELRIIGIVPVYALCSWFALRFHDVFLYIETVRDCYESYIIYCFFVLIVEFAGGERLVCESIYILDHNCIWYLFWLMQ